MNMMEFDDVSSVSDEIQRAADIANAARGRKSPGMGTFTQYAYMPRLNERMAYRNVPEWCAGRFVNAGPVPLEHCCAQIFADSTAPASHAAALDAGRTDFRKIHSGARYTECIGCPMLAGGNYKGVWMMSRIRHAHKMTNGAKNELRGLNRLFNLVNADYLHLLNKIIRTSHTRADFWKWNYTGENAEKQSTR